MTIKPDLTAQIPAELGAVHFVGIGGSGMSGIARLFLDAGHPGHRLRRARHREHRARCASSAPTIAIGHDAANVGDADTLVVTGALWPDNPEYLLAARARAARAAPLAGARLAHRRPAARLGRRRARQDHVDRHDHHRLLELGADPSFVNGGVIESLGVSSAAGSDDLFVVEADESDGSFLLYDTAVALITNVDADHLDHYGIARRVRAGLRRLRRPRHASSS